MRLDRCAALLVLVTLAACRAEPEPQLLGTLEWDRIAVPAEASERIAAIQVREGQVVTAGQVLLRLDDRRMRARLAQAQAEVALREAQVAERVQGERVERLDAARAALASARASEVEAAQQFRRQADLAGKQLVARSALDAARASRDRASAQVAQAQAQLRELTQGTRPEQLAQAESTLAGARAALEALRIDQARLVVRAPRAGRVDALPFEVGDQPAAGATVASLLVGAAPYARIFVPESQRVGLREGQAARVQVQGREGELAARIRRIASEPAFTPYYALTGDDASRLVYRTELELTEPAARELPAGLPVQARLGQ